MQVSQNKLAEISSSFPLLTRTEYEQPLIWFKLKVQSTGVRVIHGFIDSKSTSRHAQDSVIARKLDERWSKRA